MPLVREDGMSLEGKGDLGLIGVAAGLAASVCMLVVMLVLRLLLGVPSLPEMLSDGLTLVLPLTVFSAILGALESNAKPLLLVTLVIGHMVMGSLVGVGYARLWGNTSLRPSAGLGSRNPWAGGLAVAGLLWVVALLAAMPAADVGPLGLDSQTGPVPLALTSLTASLAFGLSLVIFFQGIHAYQVEASDDLSVANLARRRTLLKLATVPIALLAAGGAWQLFIRQSAGSSEEMGSEIKQTPKGKLPDEITPNNIFYTVSKNFQDPVVDAKDWSLDLRGPGGRRLTLKYADIKALPPVEQIATLTCISNEVGGDYIGNARWTGIKLRDLLTQLGVSGAVDVVLKAWDGYADSIPIEKAMQDGTLLAYLMNGEPLTPVHGFPLRLVVPGIYGMKNVKWITAIELVDYDFKGYWQNRGWSDSAVIVTMSRLDEPAKGATLPLAPVNLGGIAFSGDRGISRVEISSDAGKTWQEMKVKEPLSRYSWALWTGQWQPQEPGDYVIHVRATDGRGDLQEKKDAPPLPDGATGYDYLPLTLK